jgi:hypothetical protein
VLVLTVAIALGLLAVPAKADHDCGPTVTERLNRLNVDPSDVRKIDWVEEIRQKDDDEYVERIDAWVSLRSCKGHLVMEITPHCYVRQIYGSGECASVVP